MGCSASLPPDVVAERILHSSLEVLFDAYGKPSEQIGYTDGHYCVTPDDKATAMMTNSSLLYGEVLPLGITKLLSSNYLSAGTATMLFDLGMGLGKLVLQAFLQYPTLKYVCGVEIAVSRYNIAEGALLRMVSLQPEMLVVDYSVSVEGQLLRVHALSRKSRRTIELRRGDMWKQVRDVHAADIVVMHTDFPATCSTHLKRTVTAFKPGARFVTYHDLGKVWQEEGLNPPFMQLPENVPETDTFVTSWSSERGYHLFCWEKLSTGPLFMVASEESKEAEGTDADGPRRVHALPRLNPSLSLTQASLHSRSNSLKTDPAVME